MVRFVAFLSARYLLFFPLVTILYYLAPGRAKAPLLLAASWVFYLCTGPRYFPFLLAVILISYAAGLLMERRHKKAVLAVSLILCIGILFVFKYLNFALELLSAALAAAGLSFSSPALELLLPAGISFYLFQAMGYLMDVYRGKEQAQRSFIRYALFLSFFPSLLSGPIARSPQLMPQLGRPRPFSRDDLREGLFRFLWGAFQKLVLADRLAVLVRTVFAAPESFGRLQILSAAVAFSLQIYCDFAAYSNMAIGSARAMGFTLTENFRTPYFSRSIQEFWRRWHISLSSWFRDYLYIPLGGSRRGTARKYLNVLIVFAVSGLWHGAALTFVVWGLLNGLYQVAGAVTAPLRARVRRFFRLSDDGLPTVLLQTGITFLLTTAAWVFFQAGSLSTACSMFAGLFTGPVWVYTSMGLDWKELLVAAAGLLLLLAADLFSLRQDLWESWRTSPRPVRWCAVWVLLLASVIFGSYGPGYDAQSFIYFQF